MNKKTYAIIIGLAALLLIAGVLVLVTQQDKPKAPVATARCVMTDNSAKLNVPAEEKGRIEDAAISHLVNIPAGTNVDVNLKSYGDNMVAGSDIYSGSYGTYNFTARKDVDSPYPGNRTSWKITSFAPCKR